MGNKKPYARFVARKEILQYLHNVCLFVNGKDNTVSDKHRKTTLWEQEVINVIATTWLEEMGKWKAG